VGTLMPPQSHTADHRLDGDPTRSRYPHEFIQGENSCLSQCVPPVRSPELMAVDNAALVRVPVSRWPV
jgi:hypothetical protein